MQPKYSIVLPIYNVEKHLKKAIESVLNQSFENFEMILVNDSSPDGSERICTEYANKDSRIKLINHPENKGLSAARNTGMEVATGEYIWFMDSDDYVECDLLSRVEDSLKKNRADIVVFGLIEEYFDKKDVYRYSKQQAVEEELISTKERIHERVIELEENTLYGYAWNKFYRLDLIKKLQLKFEKITLIEDIMFNVKYCMDIQSMNILGGALYHYEKRIDNSLTSKFVPQYFELHEKRVSMVCDQYKYWKAYSKDIKKRMGNIYARYIISAMQRNCDKRSGMNSKERRRWLQNLYKNPLFVELAPYMRPESVTMSILVNIIKKKNLFLCLCMGRTIYIVKGKLPIIFAKVKGKK